MDDHVLKDVFFWIEVKKQTLFFDVKQLFATFQGSTKTLRKQAHCGIREICNFNQYSASREDWYF
jgi:hypothetical protein